MAAPRDYYADLDLPPSADVAEIKKQYRKLALKYHPDRNPGREQEVNAQFLIIQTAHDILTDPAQRAKFDANRGKSAAGRASGVRGNPWADVGQQFPTPPRRNQPARGQASGAERWNTRFSSGVPPTARQHHAQNSESKKNAAKAFENMRPRHQAKTSASSGAKSSAAPPPTPPRTASARQRAEASFGTRKTGYQPRASAFGDEPPVTNNNYATRPEPPPRPKPESAAPQKPHQAEAHARVPDPLSQFRDPAATDNRQSTPYMAQSGEKTNPFDADMGRANAAQEKANNAASSSNHESTDRSHATANRHTDGARNDGPTHATNAHNDRPNSYGFPSAAGESSSQAQTDSGQRHPIFNVPDSAGSEQVRPEQNNFSRGSVDDINTSFVNDDGSGSWQFRAGAEQSSTSNIHSASGGDNTEPARPESDPQADATAGSGQSGQSGQNHDGRFDADGWNDKFGPQTFEPPPRTNSSASPSKGSRTNSRRTKTTKPAGGENGHNAILTEDSSDEETFTWRGRKAQAPPTTTDSPQAMDIDSPPAEPASDSAHPTAPRNIPVEPTRPEWRSGDFSGVSSSKSPDPPQRPPKIPAGGSEDTEEFAASFSELRNVAPFATQTSGLKSMNDMKDSLPFDSQASDQIPLEQKAPAAPPLKFPDVPQAPRPPLTMGMPNMKTNIPTWEKYVQEFEDYMHEWDTFTGQVTDHFRERKTQIAKMRKEKGYSFLRARGDAECLDYFKSVIQDNEVRRQWNHACEEHESHLREFMACREKMK